VRVVIDTNVLVAGLLWRGPPHALLEHLRGALVWVSSPALLSELGDVIGRPKFDAILERSLAPREQLLAELGRLAEVIEAPALVQPVCRDPDDDRVLALAVAAKVDLIVSGDADLLSLGNFEGIDIVAPSEALRRIAASGATLKT
jgi:putative PIN family toxin of toxin-antitoxin system